MDKVLDYGELGFMCGLEIHQRLSTRHKLFCGCLANVAEDRAIGKVTRKQRAVAGEMGVIDVATSFESRKDRRFVYNLFHHSSCLVETDEEPPHRPNLEALRAAATISHSLHARMPEEIEVMRKSVVDGSDPSAFQRTMFVGYNGHINVGKKEVPVTSIFLEEESSGIVSNTNEYAEYGLDRLGIPLIEIDTDPVIRTPKEAKEVAMAIGLMLRLTGKAQRGIGSIRQDVNVSIKEGARVEIKGFQELEVMDAIIESEISRQLALIAIKKELHKRKAAVGGAVDVRSAFANTKAKILETQVTTGGTVVAARLRGFAGLIGKEIGPDLRLGTEISDYAKGAGVKGIIHGDEDMERYGISKAELDDLSYILGLTKGDSFILVAERQERAWPAINLAIARAKMAMEGVPSETRAPDSKRLSTRFLRPMPGKSRMYPETDALPVSMKEILGKKRLEKVDVEAIERRLHHEIANPQLADQMLWSRDLPLYRSIVTETGAKPAVVASILLEKFKELSRSNVAVDTLTDEALIRIFSLYADDKITKVGIGEILLSMPNDKKDVDRIVKERRLGRVSGEALKKLVKEFKGEDKGALMREIMLKHKTNVDGEELARLLK